MTNPVDSYVSNLAERAISGFSQSSKLNSNSSLPNSPADKKLRNAAAEFESMLLSNLWKSMKSSFAAPDDESTDPAHDSLDDMGIQAMSTAVGKAGGLGLGKLILKYLEPKIPQSQSGNSSLQTKVPNPVADIPQ